MDFNPLPMPTPIRSELTDVPAVCRVLPNYVIGLARDVGMLGRLVAGGRWPQVRRLAHQLRGSGGSYGFPEISRLADAVEAAVDANRSPAEVAPLVAALIAVMRRVDGYDPAIESRPYPSVAA